MNLFRRIISWYETCSRPWVVVVGLVVLLYGWTVPGGFFIDDYRHLRFMREFQEGERGELGLYRFLRSDAENAAMRGEGYYPWWVGDDVRYQHSRPWAERWLYSQFALFGDRAWLYHAVSLAMYVVGVLIVGRLFRLVLPEERTARWAALIFAVAGSHAVSVVFVSMQCDLLGLLLVGMAMCLAVRYVREGRVLGLGLALVYYWLALGAKESSLPAALLPGLVGWAIARTGSGTTRLAKRRGVIASGAMIVVGAIWLASYAKGGYGANNALMLDPLRATGHYFGELWTRAGVLLSTWLVPINPFLFYLRLFGKPLIPYIACAGVVTLLVFAWLVVRRGAQAAVWVVWTVVFLPLLVCTVPDDRNMLLPGVGFAALAAMWMTMEKRRKIPPRRVYCTSKSRNEDGGPGAEGQQYEEEVATWESEGGATLGREVNSSGNGNELKPTPSAVRWAAVFLFVAAQVPTAVATAYFVGRTQATVERNMAGGAAAFGRPLKSGDHLVFVNIDNDAQVLFAQYELDSILERGVEIDSGASGPKVRVSFLTDVRNPKVMRVDDHTLRLEGVEEPLLAGFLGSMGRPRGRERHEGDVVDAGAYAVKIVRMKDGEVWEIEVRFVESLASDAVRVMRCRVGEGPRVE
ncbi:MAG: hypothetical protein AABZ08_04595 [Planctomycetota bacterium]